MKIFELVPTNGRKSFGGKCKVYETENEIVLVSYNTEVSFYNKKTKELREDKHSKTTRSHQKEFRNYLGLN